MGFLVNWDCYFEVQRKPAEGLWSVVFIELNKGGDGAMKPKIMLDKSTIEALNIEERVCLEDFFQVVIPHILIDELTSSFVKEPSGGKNFEERYSKLASKLDFGDTAVIDSATQIACYDFLTGNIPLSGHPVRIDGQKTLNANGNFCEFYDVQLGRHILNRIKNGEISEEDKAKMSVIRERTQLDLNAIKASYRSKLRNWPVFSKLEDFVQHLDAHFWAPDRVVQRRWLDDATKIDLDWLKPVEIETTLKTWKNT
jgi:hypothetical protein